MPYLVHNLHGTGGRTGMMSLRVAWAAESRILASACVVQIARHVSSRSPAEFATDDDVDDEDCSCHVHVHNK